ncbi:hypothetical protein T4A_4885 [Trichinella pseudospiralis]|uniref:Uncharacterized protein n=1 Tax=Trichinella pseudospiralis TaxID=6337 RepID=A0A0V1EZD1_TRIPS|nr:hypothetical protein T4A_4885 [Trichinella pseudospiralis]
MRITKALRLSSYAHCVIFLFDSPQLNQPHQLILKPVGQKERCPDSATLELTPCKWGGGNKATSQDGAVELQTWTTPWTWTLEF